MGTSSHQIETTLGDLVNAEAALSRLLMVSLLGHVAYHVSKLATFVGAETRLFHERRAAFIKELGAERDPTPQEAAQGITGKVTAVMDGNRATFNQRINELTAVAVMIPWKPLDLGTLGALTISGGDLLALEPLVVGEPVE